MRVFVMGIPHTQTTPEFTTCAFTMKVWNLCRMLHRRGHEVIHLGTEGSTPECSKHISVTPLAMWKELYGHPGGDFYNLDTTGKYKPYHDLWAANARKALEELGGEPWTSIVCATWGGAQRIAAEPVSQFLVESGIGYRHIFAKYRVFESYAWLHMLYGAANKFDGLGWYDVVIPNSFDPDMFEYREKKSDYFLYLGRLNDDKGVKVAIDLARTAGRPLRMAGQGDPRRFVDGNKHVTYEGPVGVEARKDLLAGATALICPSYYIEPFGGVNVEAQMSGTPVICTDWGAYAETVCHGVTGYRCRSWEQFTWAAKNINRIRTIDCREWAYNNYRLDRVALMYEEFFEMVLNLKHRGWYAEQPLREDLDWMRKQQTNSSTNDIDVTKKRPDPPPVPTVWEEANRWESEWWGLEPNDKWKSEIEKQWTYARLMGLPKHPDLRSTRVLDVGCGPVSMLLKASGLTKGKRTCVGIDPLKVSQETIRRYEKAGIMFLNMKAEDIKPEAFDGGFDEVWVYNCLQHTEDPKKILDKIKKVTKAIRLFEWLDLPPCPGHPQTLTEALFDEAFKVWHRPIWNTGTLSGFGGTTTNRYIALHVESPRA
jgi:glycosyltransferase involved in cell wall biosynthesis/SAM-dependent methyltransferase